MSLVRPLGPVPGLFERHSVNLIIGTSGAGKTQFLYNQLENYGTGGGFLNYSGTPVQMGLLACSRTETDIFHSLQKFPFLSDQRNFPYQMWSTSPEHDDYENLQAAYDLLNASLPESQRPVRLLVVENFQQLMSSGKILDTQEVMKFCSALHRFCRNRDVTIVGTVGTPKMKGSECYPQLADRIPGANCWASEMNSLIGVERTKLHRSPETRPGERRIIVQTENAPDTVHWGKFMEDGRMEVSPDYIPVDEIESPADKFLDEKLTAAAAGAEFRKKDLERWAAEKSISTRTLERWTAKRVQDGLLVRIGQTRNARYRKPLPQ
jgi:hypothetical protein